MNLLRAIFGNRRKHEEECTFERRGSPIKRSKAASDRLDKATDELCRTVSLSRKDFEKLMK